ncbi:chemotaxis response regulator protein-glutamate methylesterase [Paroceanicella profunda]|uniref:Protein-glutamate methylesterase/protein-glutamine glutaminase n=2 Tax=Paroceanicella profunda TaxID=2579971 RepID=A0A5B8FVR0_9RHOB|nr:chemotaxis response regulator protein-glutamate methylesterase [Paroceanicella profunda]QDL91464.1 chemotaxis response regulator protein-glutamate methylesterase [Paroceanicella profunda]
MTGTPGARISVLIVHDSAAARAAYRALLSTDRGIAVMGSAADPLDAAAMMRKRMPDVLLLDLDMARMDGLTFLRKVMAQHPLPVVICSDRSPKGSVQALRALELGAAEVIDKPRIVTEADRQEALIRLGDAIRAAAQTRRHAVRSPPPPLGVEPKRTADAILPPARPGAARVPRAGPLVAIGASTGGTEALLEVLAALPGAAPPVVMVQHMPETFTGAFARRLDAQCGIRVAEATTGQLTEPGLALLAPGNRHMVLHRQGLQYRVEIVEGPSVTRHRPSVDVLFRSTAQVAGGNALGVLMTGMGDDGARGLLEMRQAGAETVVQDEASCVVFGMPREALAIGASDRALPLGRLAGEIMAWADRRGGAG